MVKLSRAGPEGPANGLTGCGRHMQAACCQLQAQCRLANLLLQPTGNETDGSRVECVGDRCVADTVRKADLNWKL